MQITSPFGTASNIINQAQTKLNNAAQTIANLSVQNEEVGGSQDVSASDMFKPILSLKEAEQETYAGIKLLKAQNQNIGALLNIKT